MDNMKKELYAKLIDNKNDSDLEKFELGHIFKINDICLGQSSTTLYLDLDCEDDIDLGFNSVYFSILDENMEPYEILKDKDLNKYIYEIEGHGDIYNEFLDVLNYNNAKFMLYLYDLFIDVEVTGITVEENYCKLSIPGGEITIWKDNKLQLCRRPDNAIKECKYCFRLSNKYGEHMGYIYVDRAGEQ